VGQRLQTIIKNEIVNKIVMVIAVVMVLRTIILMIITIPAVGQMEKEITTKSTTKTMLIIIY